MARNRKEKIVDKVNADQNMKIEYNLYARMENDQVVDLVMPDSDGVLRAREPVGNGWFASERIILML